MSREGGVLGFNTATDFELLEEGTAFTINGVGLGWEAVEVGGELFEECVGHLALFNFLIGWIKRWCYGFVVGER